MQHLSKNSTEQQSKRMKSQEPEQTQTQINLELKIHRLNRIVEETVYPAMEDFCLDVVLGKGPGARP
jgi:hypothetical protein